MNRARRIAPEGVSVTNLQELAETAWRSVNKTITVGQATVKVRGFSRLQLTSEFEKLKLAISMSSA